MHKFITHLNAPINEKKLIDLFFKNKDKSYSYSDPRYTEYDNSWKENFKILKIENDYLQNICNLYEINGSPRFYFLKKNSYLLPHVDHGTKCSINILLNSKNPAPIGFGDEIFYYKQALINVSEEHWVKNTDEDRILFKLSIKDEDYETIYRKIKYKV